MAYDRNPVLGCYIIVHDGSIYTYDYAKQRCANDGGALLLLNSKEKANEAQRLLGICFFLMILFLVLKIHLLSIV